MNTHPSEPHESIGDEVDLWHFAMMNDTVRNTAYETALKGALKNGGTVLDIGTGSGLLAMMAVRQGATQVITCETVPVIARKAQEIIKRNGFEGRIQVINKKSTELVAGRDFAGRADVLVTEIFDDGLLGEGAFVAIEHARQHLLKPTAQLIPTSVRVWAMGIESQEILDNNRVSQVAGFDLSGFNEFSAGYGYVGYHIQKMNYRALTAPKAVFEFDFRHIPNPQQVALELDAVAAGTCHAIAYWYELRLDGTTTISTAPGLPQLSSWKQAVQMLENPQALAPGASLSLLAHHDLTALWFTQSLKKIERR